MKVEKEEEFDANLENHQLINSNIYRLYYLNYYRTNDNNSNVRVFNWFWQPFMLPDGMDYEDAFKVLSYLTDYIEKNLNLEKCSFKSVNVLDSVLDLERLGFKRLDGLVEEDKINNLFTITGRILLFKKSELYNKYFEWYTEGVTLEVVKDIYQKIGIEFYDLIISEEERKKERLLSREK